MFLIIFIISISHTQAYITFLAEWVDVVVDDDGRVVLDDGSVVISVLGYLL
jgi:hypothetical protein